MKKITIMIFFIIPILLFSNEGKSIKFVLPDGSSKISYDGGISWQFVVNNYSYIDILKYNIYPNPTTNYINVNFLSVSQGVHKFIIINNIGNPIKSFNKNLHIGNNKLTFDLHDLNSGIYNIYVGLNNLEKIGKFIITK